MGMNYQKEFPSVNEILEIFPLGTELAEIKKKRDKEIADIITRKDSRFLVIIGPCSAHNEDAVCEYAARLARVQEKIKEKVLLIPRIYTNKPRTLGTGYKGMLHQPDHQKEPDMVEGLKAIRRMHIRVMSESHLSAADEMLYPGNYPFLEDMLAYVAIGARSVENQQHRITVSGLDVPVGMKNPTSGDLRVMFDSIHAALNPHVFIYNGWQVSTSGNHLTHAILRGSVSNMGTQIPNYHYEDLMNCSEMYIERDFPNPMIIVDTNHANSGKMYREQPRIAMEILENRKRSEILKDMVRGFMIESYLLEGAQGPLDDEFGKSITDPCLGWEDSEKLLYKIAESL